MNTRLFFNGTVLTGNDTASRTEAIIIRDGIVYATGPTDAMKRLFDVSGGLASDRTDLDGRTIVPGFNDSHVHLIEAGEQLDQPSLAGLAEDEIADRIDEYARSLPEHAPVVCRGWDYQHVPDPRMTTLDRILPDRAVMLFHVSGHAAWFNRRAFNELNLSRWIGSDRGFRVLADESGSALGVIEEPYECPDITQLFENRISNVDRVRAPLHRMIAAFQSAGVTSIQDNTWFPELYSLYQDEIEGMSVTCWPYGMDDRSLPAMDELRTRDDNFALGPVKFSVDGAIGSRTAWLWEPYAGDKSNYGNGIGSEEIYRRIEPYVALRRQVAFHAIGDRAVSAVCDAVEELERNYPFVTDLRIRIEHAQLIRESDFERIKRLGIVISAQPGAGGDFLRDVQFLGADRALKACPHRTILDWDIPLAFGGDFPFESSFKPLEAFEMISRRPSPERIDPEDILRAYTTGSAYAEKTETIKGTLEPGRRADMVVLDQNPLFYGALEHPPRVEETIAAGETVFTDAAVSVGA